MDLLEKKMEGLRKTKEVLEDEEYSLTGISYVKDMIKQLENSLLFLQIEKENGIRIPEYRVQSVRNHYYKLGDYAAISEFGPRVPDKRISWPDDGNTQPEEGWYYTIKFSEGAYCFTNFGWSTDVYPKNTFRKFFNELKEYGPTHCDTKNHCLYFKLDGTTRVGELDKNFNDIFQKYLDIVKEEIKEIRVREVEKELASLKGEQE